MHVSVKNKTFFQEFFIKKDSGDPDQTPHIAASDLSLHSLPLSHKQDAGLIWVYSI